MTKPQLQFSILLLGTAALFFVNLPDALPFSAYKGAQHAVGSDVVQVYTPPSDPSVPTVAVTRTAKNPGEKDADTGERVTVYLRNSYREDAIHRSPQRTLLVLLGCVVLYGIASLVKSRKPTDPPSAD
jgi:hypothetical protein